MKDLPKRVRFGAVSLALPALGLLAPLTAVAQDGAVPEASPNLSRWESSHSIEIAGDMVVYDAVIASTVLENDTGEPAAEVFYTAYFRTNGQPSRERPLVFSYNGGPGSASFWLHMGIMGPRRVVTPEIGPQGAPPYPLEDNAYSILDKADIVMVDPVGTGFSQTLGDTPGSEYWGIDEDARSLAQFIRRFLSEYNRWNSPRYLLGESYGTTRSAVLAGHLQRANIDLNGIVLVSSVLQFNTIQFAPGDDLPYIVNLPSYAVAARYLDALPGGQPDDLEAFMADVEEWSLTEYATALLAGGTLDPALRARVLDQMHRYTGLDPDFVDKSDLRVTAPAFEAELLRDQGRVVGRLDARFTGPAGDVLGTRPSHDPQSTAISSAYTTAFNSYIRSELGYDGGREYVPSGGTRNWNWGRLGGGGAFVRGGGTPNAAPDLANVMKRNPKLEVLLINGIYDLATPYFAAVWTMDHMGLPPELRDNITRADFAAGPHDVRRAGSASAVEGDAGRVHRPHVGGRALGIAVVGRRPPNRLPRPVGQPGSRAANRPVSLAALILVVSAGLLHAGWNLILKRCRDSLLVAAWGLLVGAALLSPVLVRAWPVPVRVWPFAISSSVVLLGYYTCLARAYERGDFSLVYPVARGTAPALLALWAMIFFGERPSGRGIAGVLTILCGLLVLGGGPLWAGRRGGGGQEAPRVRAQGVGLAFLVAFMVSVYAALDAAAVQHWSPLPYLVLVFALSGLMLVPLLAFRERKRDGQRVWRVLRTQFPAVVVVSLMTLAAYTMVLKAFQIAPVSYAGAARETGIVFGALAGWLLLGERFGPVRTLGALLVFLGVGVLALA